MQSGVVLLEDKNSSWWMRFCCLGAAAEAEQRHLLLGTVLRLGLNHGELIAFCFLEDRQPLKVISDY